MSGEHTEVPTVGSCVCARVCEADTCQEGTDKSSLLNPVRVRHRNVRWNVQRSSQLNLVCAHVRVRLIHVRRTYKDHHC